MGLFGAIATLFSLGVYAGNSIIEDERKEEARSNAIYNGDVYYHSKGKTYSTTTRRQVYLHRDGNKIYEIDVKTGRKIDVTLREILNYNEKSKDYSRLRGYPVYRCHPLTFPWMPTTNGHQVADMEYNLPCDLDFLREPLYAIYTYDSVEKKKKIYKAKTVNKEFTDKWHEFIGDNSYYWW